eukprot:TRINITY_DN3021_c2_g1_i3.p1 TRINITY_DN3021_c2_g1~~TRINITY_DN3021_c2_g1_i3.p1  ORF type:complete len:475 (+),score=48.19 TRINITY_DN3021_c2_g1_i3:79-1503(+)
MSSDVFCGGDLQILEGLRTYSLEGQIKEGFSKFRTVFQNKQKQKNKKNINNEKTNNEKMKKKPKKTVSFEDEVSEDSSRIGTEVIKFNFSDEIAGIVEERVNKTSSFDSSEDTLHSQGSNAFELLSAEFLRMSEVEERHDTSQHETSQQIIKDQTTSNTKLSDSVRHLNNGSHTHNVQNNKRCGCSQKRCSCLHIDIVKEIVYPQNCYLGEGVLGRVYRGVWKGKNVAVKIFKEEYQCALEKENVEILSREFERLLGVENENIVRCYGVDLQVQKAAIVMEYMGNGNLQSYIHHNIYPIKLINYFKILTGICKALASLHPTIVHHNVKPENILINKSGVVKLSNIGMNRFKEVVGSHGCGVPFYVAPELFTGEYEVGHKVDIFAVGILMHEMYTRQKPWNGEEREVEVARRILAGERPETPLDCPPELANMMYKCWDHNPDNRPSAQFLYQWCKKQSQIENQQEKLLYLYQAPY